MPNVLFFEPIITELGVTGSAFSGTLPSWIQAYMPRTAFVETLLNQTGSIKTDEGVVLAELDSGRTIVIGYFDNDNLLSELGFRCK